MIVILPELEVVLLRLEFGFEAGSVALKMEVLLMRMTLRCGDPTVLIYLNPTALSLYVTILSQYLDL